jgi:hypothetical protein
MTPRKRGEFSQRTLLPSSQKSLLLTMPCYLYRPNMKHLSSHFFKLNHPFMRRDKLWRHRLSTWSGRDKRLKFYRSKRLNKPNYQKIRHLFEAKRGCLRRRGRSGRKGKRNKRGRSKSCRKRQRSEGKKGRDR